MLFRLDRNRVMHAQLRERERELTSCGNGQNQQVAISGFTVSVADRRSGLRRVFEAHRFDEGDS